MRFPPELRELLLLFIEKNGWKMEAVHFNQALYHRHPFARQPLVDLQLYVLRLEGPENFRVGGKLHEHRRHRELPPSFPPPALPATGVQHVPVAAHLRLRGESHRESPPVRALLSRLPKGEDLDRRDGFPPRQHCGRAEYHPTPGPRSGSENGAATSVWPLPAALAWEVQRALEEPERGLHILNVQLQYITCRHP